ncbi:prepilin-type N-terminal cleavage/methylation domain-containing protein [Entomomonas moraniae]|uniref:Prepilin-type N-terminal cleavage/methylation domain-containing protein n=1 Tax=Entomomonas moraniae TaxID=2213226 RepID=A0A3Q9JK95_9GAMM|nr:prepilin-type N-terminal cleavage/methylation domain-containing protein [Entomomonas moraniae]AZS49407.1 prepilin-type N-terminal cleavage/methylation domain-containing protein [Entomomonas moraniae]
MSTLSQKGFTIVELLVVVLVFSILAMLAAPSLVGAINKNKVVATTNELVGLIEFARNTAKSTNQAVLISKCKSSDDCGLQVILLKDKGTSITDSTALRVMHKQDMKALTYIDDKSNLAFYPDGTRGLHVDKQTIKVFDKNGAFTSSVAEFADVQGKGDVKWQVKSGSDCRMITITALGSVKVATEGCS